MVSEYVRTVLHCMAFFLLWDLARFCFTAVGIDTTLLSQIFIVSDLAIHVYVDMYVATSCTLSEISVVCGCIHGCTLSGLRICW